MSRLQRWIQDDAGLDDGATLRYLLGKSSRPTRQGLVLHLLLAVAFIAFLLIVAELLHFTEGTVSAKVLTSLYIPTVIGQALVSGAAFAFTLHMISAQRRKQTWDQLRATKGGTVAAVRSAWAAAVYYRLSGMLGVIVYAPRLVLLALLLWDLTAFRGEYITMIAGGHTPPLPALLELPLMGAFIASAFILPISAVGLEAAVGLLFSTFFTHRQNAALMQVVLTAGRVIWSLVPVLLMRDMLNMITAGDVPGAAGGLATMLINGAAGDWGLISLHAATVDSLWASIPYSAYVGVLLLGVVLLHSGLTVLVLRWAARRAQHRD